MELRRHLDETMVSDHVNAKDLRDDASPLRDLRLLLSPIGLYSEDTTFELEVDSDWTGCPFTSGSMTRCATRWAGYTVYHNSEDTRFTFQMRRRGSALDEQSTY